MSFENGWITISPGGRTPLRVLLGEEGVGQSGGIGAWQDVARPHRKAITEYTGPLLKRRTVPIIITGSDSGMLTEEACEWKVERLIGYALPAKGESLPSHVNIAGLPVLEGVDWVIEGIEWGSFLVNAQGSRVRQSATIALVELEAASVIVTKKVIAPVYRRYVVKRGDNLAKVAGLYLPKKRTAKQLSAMMMQIKTLNQIRDPRSWFKSPKNVGKPLRIPPK